MKKGISHIASAAAGALLALGVQKGVEKTTPPDTREEVKNVLAADTDTVNVQVDAPSGIAIGLHVDKPGYLPANTRFMTNADGLHRASFALEREPKVDETVFLASGWFMNPGKTRDVTEDLATYKGNNQFVPAQGKIEWSSQDNSIVSVKNGILTAGTKEGMAVIEARDEAGHVAQLPIRVTKETIAGN
jgi:hypothetical protein